jgi:hypothetical protein
MGQGKIVFSLVVILSLLMASCVDQRSGRNAVAPATSVPVKRQLPPLPARPLSAELKKIRERSMRTASSLRGLNFTGEVGMTELSGWEYGKRASEMAEMLGGEELRVLSRLAAAGGVLPEGTDLAALAASFTALSAGATYSPLDKQILLVDKSADASLVTHEFVHALQDQHFDLMKLLDVRPYDFDRTEALFAVIEGDAVNVQRRAEEGEAAYTRKPLEDILRQERERFQIYRREVGELFPPLLIETFSFRYRDGARFIEAVRRSGGEGAVNELFRRPPASSEQVLHPEKYQTNEAPRQIQLDEAAFASNGWRTTVSTPLGEIGVRGLLMAGVSEREATVAAAGWGGDRAYLFEGAAGGGTLFVWKTVWDKDADAQDFFRAYNQLQRARQGAQAQDSFARGNEAETRWLEGGRVTIVHRTGERVMVVRGTESAAALALALK